MWGRYVVRIFNGHFRWIHCFKVVSNTKRLRVKDKQSDTIRSLFCFYQGRSLHTYLGFAPHSNLHATNGTPRRFCMQHLIFLARVSQNRSLDRTLFNQCLPFVLIFVPFIERLVSSTTDSSRLKNNFTDCLKTCGFVIQTFQKVLFWNNHLRNINNFKSMCISTVQKAHWTLSLRTLDIQ